MIGLTPRQRAYLDAIASHQTRTGAMPTIDELRETLGLASRSAAAKMLARLESRGAIARVRHIARSIALNQHLCPHCGNELSGKRTK